MSQLVQNAVARLLIVTCKKQHITAPVVASLHWLPVHFKIHFKVLVLALNP